MAGVRIDDVVIAYAAFVEKSLVVARRGYRRIDERYARDHLALAFARVADPHHPGFAEAIADDAAIAAGADVGAREAAPFQDVDAAIHRVTLGDAAEIDAHPLLRELHRLEHWI